MVDVMGHLAMGLLWAIPAWFVWSRRVAVAFVALTGVAALLPDIDLFLDDLLPSMIHHHGVTHTIVFVVGMGVLVGALLATVLAKPIDRYLDGERFDRWSLFGFATAALVVGGLSHLFADMLSAPDISTPIEPLWPFVQGSWGLDLVWYNNPWWNVGLLTVAVLLHLGLAYVIQPAEHPYRLAEQ